MQFFAPARGSRILALALAGAIGLGGVSHSSVASADPFETISVSPTAAPPQFTMQPTPLIAIAGEPVELKAEAAGVTSFRWQRATAAYSDHPDASDVWEDINPQLVPSATAATLHFDQASAEQGGLYRVIAVGDGGEKASDPAELTVMDQVSALPVTVDEPSDAAPSAFPDELQPTAEVSSELAPAAAHDQPTGLTVQTASVDPADAPAFPEGTLADYISDFVELDTGNPEIDGVYAGDWLSFFTPRRTVTEDPRPGSDVSDPENYPFLAWRWGGDEVWTYAESPTEYSRYIDIPALPTGHPVETMQLEVAIVYKPVGDQPLQFLHYWQNSYPVHPPYTPPAEKDARITKLPQDVTVQVGKPATFTIEIEGYPFSGAAPYIRTQEMGSALPPELAIRDGWIGEEILNSGSGAKRDVTTTRFSYEYTIAKVTPEMDGMVVEMTSDDGRLTSNPHGWPETISTATLHVTDYQQPADWAAPTVTTQPHSLTQAPDDSGVVEVVLNSAGDGTPKPNVRWQRKLPGGAWEDMQDEAGFNATGPDLYLVGSQAVSQAQSGAQFRARYTNRLGEVFTDPATIVVRGQLADGWRWGESDELVQYLVPEYVEKGQSFTVSGKEWKNTGAKNASSIIAVRIDGLKAGGDVHNPVTGEILADKSIIAAARANFRGAWSATIPFPNGWEAGQKHTVTLSTGELSEGDNVRSESAQITVLPVAELPVITAQPESVEDDGSGVAEFLVEAEANVPMQFQWQYRFPGGDWEDYKGGEDATSDLIAVDIANPGRMHGWEYRVLVSTSAGTVASEAATFRAPDTVTGVRYDASRSYHYGDTIEVSLDGLEAGEEVGFSVGNDTLEDVEADESGVAKASVMIPAVNSYGADLTAGAVHITAAIWTRDVFLNGPDFIVGPDASVPPPTLTPFPTYTEVAEGSGGFTMTPEVEGALQIQWNPGRNGVIDGFWGHDPVMEFGPEWTELRNDGTQLSFTAWNAGGAVRTMTELDVIPADGSPSYPHVTAESEAEGDAALIWAERDIEPGGSARVSGTGWLKADGTSGSTIAIKLNYRLVNDQTGQYERAGSDIVKHPLNGSEDSTIWKIVEASADGTFSTVVDLPENIVPGQKLALAVSSGVFAEGDMQRMIVTPSLVVDGVEWEEPPMEVIQCTPSVEKPTWEIQEQSKLGGKLKLSGKGWCHPRSGGSTIAIKIDDGAYSHLTDDLNQNRTIWDIVYADDETGDWETEITLPDGTTSGPLGSAPAFPEGEHSIRLLTGSLKEYDAIRTIGPSTGQATHFVVGEYRPNALPTPLDIEGGALTEANKNGVTVTQQQAPAPGQWTVTVPGGKKGDWVYVDAYAGPSSRGYFPEWKQLDANGQVTLSLAGVTLAVGDLNVTVQNGNQGHVGELLGWAQVTIEKPKSQLPPVIVPNVVPPRVVTPPPPGAAPVVAAPTVVTPTAAPTARVAAAQSTAPATIPEQPVKRGSQLNTSNAGQVTGVIEGDVVTLTVADGEPNQWIYAYVYTGVQVRPIGWVQLDANKQMKVDISELPDGNHKIALVSVDGVLVGWTSAAKGKITAAQLQQEKTDEVLAQNAEQEAAVLPPVLTGMPTWMVNTLLAVGALLLIAAAAAAAMALRNRREQAQ
ncbi:MAG: hypothetical protein QM705_03050 [Ancrocorticia sp.]